jgi:hypothetical protein
MPDGQTVQLSWGDNLLVADAAELTMLGSGDRTASDHPSVWHGRLSTLYHNTINKVAQHCTGIPTLAPQDPSPASRACSPKCNSAPFLERPTRRRTKLLALSTSSPSTYAGRFQSPSAGPATTSSSWTCTRGTSGVLPCTARRVEQDFGYCLESVLLGRYGRRLGASPKIRGSPDWETPEKRETPALTSDHV